MIKIIAKYLRISAEDIDLEGFDRYESNSITNQREFIDDYLNRLPEYAECEIIEEIDDGWTGTNFSRPGVQKLIELARSGRIDCIVVKDLSRWGRNYIEVGDFLEQKFPEWGVRFISINDNYDSDMLNGGLAGVDIGFRNLVYEMYSQDLSEKVRSGLHSAAKSGKTVNALAVYGYTKDPDDKNKLLIDQPSADVVKRIFSLAEQGFGSFQIAKTLNEENAITPQARKMQLGFKRKWSNGDISIWRSAVVSKILRDERYTGKSIYGKRKMIEMRKQSHIPAPESEWIVVENALPVIITKEQYRAVNQNPIERKSSKQARSQCVLLFRRKLKCGHCGMGLMAARRSGYVKYRCYTGTFSDEYDCSVDNWIYEKDIAIAVLAALQQQITVADNARKKIQAKSEQLRPSVEKLKDEIFRLKKSIEKSKSTKLGLWEKYRNGEISAEGFQIENEKLDDNVIRVSEKIAEIQTRTSNLDIESERENAFIERLCKQAGIKELTRPIVEEFISDIKIYSADRIEIVFKYADEYAKFALLFDSANGKAKV